MQHVFVFTRVALAVQPWSEPRDTGDERGVRVEVRLLGTEQHRGSKFASQRLCIDRALYRFDLFDLASKDPGNFQRAHFHADMQDNEPGERILNEQLSRDPFRWIETTLSDLDALLRRSGETIDGADDAQSLRNELPAVMAAIRHAHRRALPAD